VLIDEPNFILFSHYYFSIRNNSLCTYMREDIRTSSGFH